MVAKMAASETNETKLEALTRLDLGNTKIIEQDTITITKM